MAELYALLTKATSAYSNESLSHSGVQANDCVLLLAYLQDLGLIASRPLEACKSS